MSHCKHEEKTACFKIYSNGTKNYGYQCSTCGRWEAKKQTSFSSDIVFTEFDESISGRYWQARRDEENRERAEKSREWWQWYNQYLSSEQWKRRREKILERDNHTCQGCLYRKATQVHHLTYAHVGNELAFELTSLCNECHDKAHQKEGVTNES